MSKMTPHELQCPHCGHKQMLIVWDSINVSLHLELKEKLYAAEINLFECGRCQNKTFINAPLLYHDMEMEFCVLYYPPEWLDDESFLRHFNTDGSLAMTSIPAAFAKSSAYLVRPHIVFDMNEMIRYVAFRDRVVAANKK